MLGSCQGSGNRYRLLADYTFMAQRFDSIQSVVADLQKGKMVIVVDDPDRENEGDLIMAAQFITPDGGQFHGQARPRPDLRAHHFRAPQATGHRANGPRKTARTLRPISR